MFVLHLDSPLGRAFNPWNLLWCFVSFLYHHKLSFFTEGMHILIPFYSAWKYWACLASLFDGQATFCILGQNLFLTPFASPILTILFFHFFQSSKPFNSILIFLTIFFNFPNPYTISLNFNHLYHLEICKVKPFFKPFRMVKNDWNGFPKYKTLESFESL